MINYDRYSDIKAIIQKLEPHAWRALPLFYALSECDIVSSLYVWYLANQYTKESSARSFIYLGKTPSRVIERHIDDLKAYHILEADGSLAATLAVLLYDSYKSANNNLGSLPPSKDTFHQHLLSACCQAGYCGDSSLKKFLILKSGN